MTDSKKIVLGIEAAPLVDMLIDVAARNEARKRQSAPLLEQRPRAPAVSSG